MIRRIAPLAVVVPFLSGIAAVAQPIIEIDERSYAKASEDDGYAVVAGLDGFTGACPDEDDVWGFNDALTAGELAEAERLVQMRGCLVLFDRSWGRILGATVKGWLHVEFEFFPEYADQTPTRLYVDPTWMEDLDREHETLNDLQREIVCRRFTQLAGCQ